jgi:hypothetical protein
MDDNIANQNLKHTRGKHQTAIKQMATLLYWLSLSEKSLDIPLSCLSVLPYWNSNRLDEQMGFILFDLFILL